MANFSIKNVRIQLKHDTAENWANSTLTLMAGEMAIETDTNKFKIGDGTKTFAQLPYADADGIAAFVEGNAGKGKVIKTNNDGLLDDSFLKAIEVDQTTDNTSTATSVLTSATIDGKGRTSATTKMGIAAVGGPNAVNKLVQANSSGELADSFLHDAAANTGDFTVANITVDAKGRVIAASTTPVTDAGGSSNGAKLVKTDGSGELADSFLKNQLAASDDTDAGTVGRRAGAYTMANVTVDQKGRVTAISSSTPADLPIATDTTLGAVKAGAANDATAADKIDKVLVDANGVMSVAEVTKATQLSIARTISASGDATGSASFNGTADVNIALTLKDVTRTDVAADNSATTVITGITDDGKGRITGTSQMIATTTGGAAADSGKLVKLGADGKLDDSIIPALAIGEVREYTSVADMNAAVSTAGVQSGDVAVVTNATTPTEDGVYIYTGSAYVLIKVPGTAIQTVNNKVGPHVVLSTGDIAEGPVVTYVAATGTYVTGTTYYTDNTGTTEVDTSDFVAGTTDVSAYYVAQNGNINMYFTTARATTVAEQVLVDGSYILDCGTASGFTDGGTNTVEHPVTP